MKPDERDMTYSMKSRNKVVMIFSGHCSYHFISPETDYNWQSKTLAFKGDVEDGTFPLTWTKICQVSATEWMMFMG